MNNKLNSVKPNSDIKSNAESVSSDKDTFGSMKVLMKNSLQAWELTH